MIVCKPEGGISNRLKFIISCLVEYDEICLDWTIPRIGGVGCHFNDLFENKFNIGTGNIISHTSFIHEEMNTNNVGDKKKLNEELKQKYISIIKKLKPITYVSNMVDYHLEKLPEEYTTVSVRTFKSFPQEHESWGKHFSINYLFDYLNKIDGLFLLTCDDTETMELIRKKYKDQVYTTPKRTKFGDFKTIEGMQDILIDQLIGAKSSKIIGTYPSSYSEMQWWFGLCQPEYINMKLHTR